MNPPLRASFAAGTRRCRTSLPIRLRRHRPQATMHHSPPRGAAFHKNAPTTASFRVRTRPLGGERPIQPSGGIACFSPVFSGDRYRRFQPKVMYPQRRMRRDSRRADRRRRTSPSLQRSKGRRAPIPNLRGVAIGPLSLKATDGRVPRVQPVAQSSTLDPPPREEDPAVAASCDQRRTAGT